VRRLALAGVAAAALAACLTAPASASVTLGQAAGVLSGGCNSNVDIIQPTVTSGNTYVAPVAGTVTSWSANAGSGSVTMKMFRNVGGNVWSVVGHAGPSSLPANNVAANIPVRAGDVLGLQSEAVGTSCVLDAPGESYTSRGGDLMDNEANTFTTFPGTNQRLHILAVLQPSNAFTLGEVSRNKKKGTATIKVEAPNPGDLVATGKGVAGQASPTGPGSVELTIRAKGTRKKRLNRNGKLTLNAAITFTPSGGDPSTQFTKLKLKKN
jgi:hypothetical protein